jgi:hypothetical protein
LKKSVTQAKTIYEKYDSGKINTKQFKSELHSIGFQNDDKISHMLRSGDYIKPSFTSIVREGGLLKKESSLPFYTPQQIKNSTFYNFHREYNNRPSSIFKKVRDKKDESRERLSNSVEKFVSGKIDKKSFEKVLKDNSINPKIEEVKTYNLDK